MKQIRVITIIYNDLALGGIQRKIIDLLHYLDQNYPDIQVNLYLYRTEGLFLSQVPPKVTIKSPRAHSYRFNTLAFTLWLMWQLSHNAPDRILTFMDYAAIPSIFAKLILRLHAPLVIGEDILTSKNVLTESHPKFRFFLIKLFYPLAQNIIVQTEVQKQDLQLHLNPSCHNRIVVSPNWLPLDFPPKTNPKPSRATDILFVGRLDPQKNIPRFIDIIEQVKQIYPKISVKIVGSGSKSSEIAHLIRRKKLAANITMIPATTNPTSFYLSAKIFLLTSNYEGFPLTLMEAISCGCFPIFYDLPELRTFFDKYTSKIQFNDINEAVKLVKSTLDSPSPEIIAHYQARVCQQQTTFLHDFAKTAFKL